MSRSTDYERKPAVQGLQALDPLTSTPSVVESMNVVSGHVDDDDALLVLDEANQLLFQLRSRIEVNLARERYHANPSVELVGVDGEVSWSPRCRLFRLGESLTNRITSPAPVVPGPDPGQIRDGPDDLETQASLVELAVAIGTVGLLRPKPDPSSSTSTAISSAPTSKTISTFPPFAAPYA